MAAIIFAESCLIFFLPGDSLLFFAGFLEIKPAGLPHVNQPLPLIIPLFFLAAALGDHVGYVVGRRIGTRLFNRPNSRMTSALLMGGQRPWHGFLSRRWFVRRRGR